MKRTTKMLYKKYRKDIKIRYIHVIPFASIKLISPYNKCFRCSGRAECSSIYPTRYHVTMSLQDICRCAKTYEIPYKYIKDFRNVSKKKSSNYKRR
jgi:hypothetical protein